MRKTGFRLRVPKAVRSALQWGLFVGTLVFLICPPVWSQSSEFLPEVDAYLDLNPDMRVWFQAKGTREGRTAIQSEIGPSIDFYIKSLPKLAAIAAQDSDKSEGPLLVLSLGYRYLAQASGAPGTNRIEPVATLQPLLWGGFRLLDRNRFDLDWETGSYYWRYRNRLQLERGFVAGRHRITPYASAEIFYQSKYQKWSETDLYAGFRLPVTKIVAFNTYYEHENNTGKVPNQQVNAAGLILNLFFSRH